MPKRMYYAEDDPYSSESSFGFVNTSYAVAFTSKKERDEYVRNRDVQGCYAISAARAYELLCRPGRNREFSVRAGDKKYCIREYWDSRQILRRSVDEVNDGRKYE